jgi:hypothetical protein
MPSDKHPLDVLAEKLEAIADKPVAAQDASPDYWEFGSSTDPTVVGDYPQTEPCDEEALFQLDESEGLDPDGFLTVPVPEQRLLPTALWTDVLKAGLPASWSAGHLFG